MKRILVALFATVSTLAAQPAPGELSRSAESLGWQIAVSASAAGQRTLFEAIEQAAALGQKLIEGEQGQRISESLPRPLGWELTGDEVTAVAEKLNRTGVTMASYRLERIPSEPAAARRLFAFAQRLGVQILMADVAAGDLSLVDELCREFGISVAVHGGSETLAAAYRDPARLLDLLSPHSRRIGVCGEIAHWVNSGLDPAGVLGQFKGRLLAVRVQIPGGAAGEGRDVSRGSDAIALEELFKEAYRLEFKSLYWTVALPAGPDPSGALQRSLATVSRIVSPIAAYHRNYITRTRGARRFAEMTAEERRKIADAVPAEALARPRRPRRLLVMDLNVGRFGHPSIPYANLAVELMGKRTGAYETVFSNDPSMLEPGQLSRFDAVFLNNTIGDIFGTPAYRLAFRDFIWGGGGLVANHAATVTATDWPEFGEILGARGASHRISDEKVTVRVEDPRHPLTRMFGGESFEFADEFFRFQAPYSREGVRVLLSIDPAKTDMEQGRCAGECTRADGDYPISWIRRYGEGRVFYCSMGHNPYVFWHPQILRHFLAGLQFALGDLEADTTPIPLEQQR